MPSLLYLSESDVARAFTPDVARASQRAAFEALGRGDAVLPARLLVPGRGDDVAFCYAARTGGDAPAVSKFGSVHAGNVDAGVPAVHALVTVLDPTTGVPVCVMAGTTLTTLRTAAASAVAVDSLLTPARREGAGHDADATPEGAGVDVAVIGSGVQAEAHLHALCADAVAGRSVVRIRLAARNTATAGELVARWERDKPTGTPPIEIVASAEEACVGADVIATCTTSTTPVLDAAWVEDGALVVSVGSFEAGRSEVPVELMREARVVVDDRETALADNGCVVAAIEAGALERHAVETLGEVLAAATDGATPGSEHRVTVYCSVGVGVQDAAAADAVHRAARAGGVGVTLPL